MANVEGKATAITVITPVKPWAPPLLALVFWAGRHLTFTLKKLQQLSFIHYARWAVIPRFPDGGDGERLHHSYLFFESNFNGTWDQYIDAFSEVVPARMRAIWGTSYAFPGPIPVDPFKAWIRRNEYVANHFWSAYPGAAATEVISAARVADALEAFQRRSAGLPAPAFAAEYARLITDVQADL
jgi:hypothetical protein